MMVNFPLNLIGYVLMFIIIQIQILSNCFLISSLTYELFNIGFKIFKGIGFFSYLVLISNLIVFP